jgi:hypothetical protein
MITNEELIEVVKQYGGIVHKDGNIFLTNVDVLRDVMAEALAIAINRRQIHHAEND